MQENKQFIIDEVGDNTVVGHWEYHTIGKSDTYKRCHGTLVQTKPEVELVRCRLQNAHDGSHRGRDQFGTVYCWSEMVEKI